MGISDISMKSMLSILILLSLIVPSLVINIDPISAEPPSRRDQPYEDLIQKFDVTPDWIYDESSSPVVILYSLYPPLNLSMGLVEIYVVGYKTNITLYNWTSNDGGEPSDFYNWYMNRALMPGSYSIFVHARTESYPVVYHDVDEYRITVHDSTGLIGNVSMYPNIAVNDGSHFLNLSMDFNRIYNGIRWQQFQIGFFNNQLQDWVDFPINLDMIVDNVSVEYVPYGMCQTWFEFNVPLDIPPGQYNVHIFVNDSWGYSEEFDKPLFSISSRPLPPELVQETIEMVEDRQRNIELNDYIKDPNRDKLQFSVESWTGNLSINQSSSKVYITPDPDWFGEGSMTVWVTDGEFNVNITIGIIVEPDDDPFTLTKERTFYIEETFGYLSFNPSEFYHDIDGSKLGYFVSLGWEWVNEGNDTYRVPVWHWHDDNFEVQIVPDTDFGNITMIRDLETGTGEVEFTLWEGDLPRINFTFIIEIIEYDDIPQLLIEEVIMIRGESITLDVEEILFDPDGPDPFLNVTCPNPDIQITFEEARGEITIISIGEFVGLSHFYIVIIGDEGEVLVSFNVTLKVLLPYWPISGTITFLNEDVHLAGISMEERQLNLIIGEFNVTSTGPNHRFNLELIEGEYPVSYEILFPEFLLYNEDDERSGYVLPNETMINLEEEYILNIVIEWRVFEVTEPPPEGKEPATWEDIDFANMTIERLEEDKYRLIIPVFNIDEKDFKNMSLSFRVVRAPDDLELVYEENIDWDEDNGTFYLDLPSDHFNDDTGEIHYFVSDVNSNAVSNIASANLEGSAETTLLGLVVLMVLVLVLVVVVLLVVIIVLVRNPRIKDDKTPSKIDDEEEEDEDFDWGDDDEEDDLDPPQIDDDIIEPQDIIEPPEDDGGLDLEATVEIPFDIGGATPSETDDGKFTYDVDKKIGSGGFADVYLCTDADGDEIAVKMPRKTVIEGMDKKLKKRFMAEADHWSKLYSNPDVKGGIVGILAYDIDPDPFIAMEYMDKGNLRTNLKKMSFDDKVEMMAQLLETMYNVHLLGVIHRDIKPENILYNKKGEWKIADWGLSKVLLDSSGSTTQAGTIKATLAYSAPEQIDRDAFGGVDRRTDVYQAGCLAYEIFTGTKPFEGAPALVIHRIITKEPKHPSEVNDEIPKKLGDAILKAMKKVKKERWRDAMMFRDAVMDSVGMGRS